MKIESAKNYTNSYYFKNVREGVSKWLVKEGSQNDQVAKGTPLRLGMGILPEVKEGDPP